MGWPEISIEDFPPRRDDEPSSLRQEIIDELSDHFACALNRELLKNPDEQVARGRVLEQFGDPIKVARQLWLEAMKEKIMSQRILTGVSVVMALCGFIVVGLVWSMMKQNERVNLLLLERLDQQAVPAASGSEGMNRIAIRLVQQGDPAKPATGFSGTLTKDDGKAESFSLDVAVDDSGKLDFGKLPWGKYYLKLHAPWDETAILPSFVTIPGRDYSQTIKCPAGPPGEVPVKFQVHWPEGLNDDEWVVLCDFRYPQKGKSPIPYVLKSKRNIQNHFWTFEQNLQEMPRGVYLVNGESRVAACPLGARGNYQDTSAAALKFDTEISIKQGEYHLPVVYLIRKTDLKSLARLSAHPAFDVIAVTPFSNPSMRIENRLRVGTGYSAFVNVSEKLSLGTGLLNALNSPLNNSRAENIHGIQLKEQTMFTAVKGSDNVWEIDLPPREITFSYLENIQDNL
ncbi:prealbumin-like fold domain-containing protein [Gimesia chilikensis]|uniref:Uncharacterized protein n=1 Tax=Gimesia chilikensis TaxID=2605989 RepID=A0A517PTZ2_9PLAN|nr:prealbumin-like fold domain-containing protein [Gimesia chilikensis]QDT22840.1 hypothetical protein HG66A1_46510 [Gimesia chilikensis]